jgi:hypothetical protein
MIELHDAYLTPAQKEIGVLNHVEIKRNNITLGKSMQDGLLNMVDMIDSPFEKYRGESIPIVPLIANEHSL